jgi:hypothetical protein
MAKPPVTKVKRVNNGKNQVVEQFTYYQFIDPAPSVHSKAMDSWLLVDVSTMIDGKPFLDQAGASQIIADSAYIQTYSDTASQAYKNAEDKAVKYANNFKGERAALGLNKDQTLKRWRLSF